MTKIHLLNDDLNAYSNPPKNIKPQSFITMSTQTSHKQSHSFTLSFHIHIHKKFTKTHSQHFNSRKNNKVTNTYEIHSSKQTLSHHVYKTDTAQSKQSYLHTEEQPGG